MGQKKNQKPRQESKLNMALLQALDFACVTLMKLQMYRESAESSSLHRYIIMDTNLLDIFQDSNGMYCGKYVWLSMFCLEVGYQ